MSHTTKVTLQIKDRSVLEEIIKEMGYKLVNKKSLTLYSRRKEEVECQIEVKDGFNIGFKKVNGLYQVITDWYRNRTINREDFTRNLNQKYAFRIINKTMRKKGFKIVNNTLDKNKTMQIVLRKWN